MQEIQVQSQGQEDSPGEGNGNPLQYSCLETPMDRGAWWAPEHGAAKSQMAEWLTLSLQGNWKDSCSLRIPNFILYKLWVFSLFGLVSFFSDESFILLLGVNQLGSKRITTGFTRIN